MGKGFGELYKMRGIITYKISPFEIKAFHGVFTHGIQRTLRRIADNFFYIVPRKYFFCNKIHDLRGFINTFSINLKKLLTIIFVVI